jgi:FlaA1/EpsC-like NDP-sugar epimerase
VQFAIDAGAWVVALPVAAYARFDFDVGPARETGIAWAIVLVIGLQGVIGLLLGLYRRQFSYGSLDEILALALTVAGVSLAGLGVAGVFSGSMVPRSAPIIGGSLALLLMCAARFVARRLEDRSLRPAADRSEPVVVFGAGNAGHQIVRTMMRTPESHYRPVALLDDDPSKARLHVDGLRVEGTRDDIVRVAARHDAKSVLVAIPSATGDVLSELSEPLAAAGLNVLVLPPVDALFGTVTLSDVRPLTIADLLGRNPSEIDTAAIAGYVRDRRVLVTGAGGSIGSELCRQLHRYGPATLVMLDRDESGLHGTQLSIEGQALLDSSNVVLADIRDRDRVVEIFGQHRPEVVFHAAALKHQPLLERHPEEAWKTNVVGTHHVLEASAAVGVTRFVNISTDKAADPAGVLGFSKRVCERLTAAASADTGRPYVSVRFGNVLGSRGSVLGTFEEQVAHGGPVTVTDPEATRFFMTVEEAVALTVEAGAIGEPGEVLVLDMGEPVRIVDIARSLAERADPPVDIVITGLRSGEKLHEVLLGAGEIDDRPIHPLVSHVGVPPLSMEAVRRACSANGEETISSAALAAAAGWGLDRGDGSGPGGDSRPREGVGQPGRDGVAVADPARPQRVRSVRGNRTDERIAVVIAIASAVAAAMAGARPTGSDAVDAILVAAAVGAVTWAAASAPWWAISSAAAVAALIAVDGVLTLVAAAAFVTGLWIGVRRRDLGVLRGVLAAVALNVLIRAELEGFFGASALIGVTTAALLFVAGIRRRRRHVRRIAWTGVGIVGTAAAAAAVGFGFAAASARTGLIEGHRLARDGIAELRRGNFDTAAQRFSASADAFASADSDLSGPWARPAALVPVMAQNHRAVTDLAGSAAANTDELATALGQLDPDGLRLTDGRIDLTTFATFREPLTSVQETLDRLDATIDDAASPWLVAPFQDRLASVDADIAENEAPLDNAILAVELGPRLLGSDRPRRYLVAFTTPAEARGLGGFMGNFAVFVADQGELTMTRFGRTAELNGSAEPTQSRVVTGPDDWLDEWGRFGFTSGAGGTTGSVPWSNVTMSPHFPSTAEVMAELFPQSGGRPVDGVFAMDPYVLAELVEMVGPIDVPRIGRTLSADEVMPFLLTEQYEIDDHADRVDLLEDVADITVDRVLSGSLPTPTELGAELGALARQDRLVGWSADPAEQELFERVGLAGKLPELADGDGSPMRDGVAVVVNNAAGNKIDTFLERNFRYRATVDVGTGEVTGTVEVTLKNTAPAGGLPAVVLGNLVDEPPGTNRALVSVYTAVPMVSAELDTGAPLLVETGREQGWMTARAGVTIPAGVARTITFEVAGRLDLSPEGYSLLTRPQPLVAPERYDVLVGSTSGDTLAEASGRATSPLRIESGD